MNKRFSFLTSHYHSDTIDAIEHPIAPSALNSIGQLFASSNITFWLRGLIDWYNQNPQSEIAIKRLVRDWTISQQQHAVDFFNLPQCIHLINAVFFLKIHPEQLFDNTIYPEHFISLCSKLELLHQSIILVKNEVYQWAEQNGIKLPIDRLLHNADLPHGVTMDISEQDKQLIREAIIQVKITHHRVNDLKIESVRSLLHAYKFWFNPCRLIDTVLLLQYLVSQQSIETQDFLVSMLPLYQQLTTTECLDLYGYFSNKDTQHLLQAFYLALHAPQSLPWLNISSTKDIQLFNNVFSALKDVIEGLRLELKNRAITTDPYVYEHKKTSGDIRKRNRNALFRVLTIYSSADERTIQDLEQLFLSVE